MRLDYIDAWSVHKADDKQERIHVSSKERAKIRAGKATIKTGTKLGIAALVLAMGTVILRFYLARQVNLPDDRTLFVTVFLSAAVLGVAAHVK